MASYAKSAARREEILAAALAVFAAQGYGGTSLREVARRVGLSLTGVIHHFGTREALLAAILRARDEHDLPRVRAAGDAIDGLLWVLGHNRTVPGLISLYTTLAGDPGAPARAFFAEHYTEIATIADAVRARQAQGRARPGLDPEHTARILVAAADGLQMQWLAGREVDMAAELAALWHALAAR